MKTTESGKAASGAEPTARSGKRESGRRSCPRVYAVALTAVLRDGPYAPFEAHFETAVSASDGGQAIDLAQKRIIKGFEERDSRGCVSKLIQFLYWRSYSAQVREDPLRLVA